jgi:LuxR family transcriptional regulator, maltose regulon positive regulatory protein
MAIASNKANASHPNNAAVEPGYPIPLPVPLQRVGSAGGKSSPFDPSGLSVPRKACAHHHQNACSRLTLAEKYVGAKSVSAAMVTGLSALLRYERGDTNAAEIAVLDELSIIETTVYHESFLSAYTVLVRAAMVRGDTERALMLLDRAQRLAGDRCWERLVAMFLVERVRLLLRERRVQEASDAADQLQKIQDTHPAPRRCSWSDIRVGSAIVNGLLALASGRIDAAARLLTTAYDELLSTDNRHGALRVGMELSNTFLLGGNLTGALDVLRQGMAWARNAKATNLVLERPRDFNQLLTVAESANLGDDVEHRAFFEYLVTKCRNQDGTSNKPTDKRASKSALSARERSIIEFIAGGQSNKQIARTLDVTPETVKTYVKRIFISFRPRVGRKPLFGHKASVSCGIFQPADSRGSRPPALRQRAPPPSGRVERFAGAKGQVLLTRTN